MNQPKNATTHVPVKRTLRGEENISIKKNEELASATLGIFIGPTHDRQAARLPENCDFLLLDKPYEIFHLSVSLPYNIIQQTFYYNIITNIYITSIYQSNIKEDKYDRLFL